MKKVAIIGGGASGMACAVFLARKGAEVVLLERGERLGRKLSVTGNGQGNVTNLAMGPEYYFSDDPEKVSRLLQRFGAKETVSFLESMGGIFLPDERGRVYPASRQASAVTDLFRLELERLNVKTLFRAEVKRIFKSDNTFRLAGDEEEISADAVVLSAGGRAAPNFGTDGSAYELAKGFSHTVVDLKPVLVQLRCDPASVRGLRGIRVDAAVRVKRGNQILFRGRGDVLFTESGVSGDAVFRASSYAETGDTLEIDFLPEVSAERLRCVLKREKEPLLCVLNNGLARFLYRNAEDREKLFTLVKNFSLTVTGTLGFAYAQVTRGGIPLKETDENLMSKFCPDLFFTGEILNADGECGGYNLQWAFTSAYAAAEGVLK